MAGVNIIVHVTGDIKKIVNINLNKDDPYFKKEDKQSGLNEMIEELFQIREEIVKRTSEVQTFRDIFTCKVCGKLSLNGKFIQTNCQHIFCEICTKAAIDSSEKSCPICLKTIEKNSLCKIKIYENSIKSNVK